MELKEVIKNNVHESRKEWIIWMMERAGKKNGNNKDWQFWQQHNKPLEIKGQQMFDEKLLYIHQIRYRQVLLQEKRIGSIAVQEISAE